MEYESTDIETIKRNKLKEVLKRLRGQTPAPASAQPGTSVTDPAVAEQDLLQLEAMPEAEGQLPPEQAQQQDLPEQPKKKYKLINQAKPAV